MKLGDGWTEIAIIICEIKKSNDKMDIPDETEMFIFIDTLF